MNIRDQHHIDLEACFDLVDVVAFFVKQKGGDIDRYLRVHGGGVVLHGFLLQDAQNV